MKKNEELGKGNRKRKRGNRKGNRKGTDHTPHASVVRRTTTYRAIIAKFEKIENIEKIENS